MEKRKITVLEANISDNEVILSTTEPVMNLVPAEQLLVDSDQCTFVYLTEDKEDYTYILLPEQIWPILKRGLEQNLTVILDSADERLELSNFNQELDYLIQNIQGNHNYGELMVSKVEEIFHT